MHYIQFAEANSNIVCVTMGGERGRQERVKEVNPRLEDSTRG